MNCIIVLHFKQVYLSWVVHWRDVKRIPFNFYIYIGDWQKHPKTLEIATIQQIHKGKTKDSERDFNSEIESEGGFENESEDECSKDSDTKAASFNPFSLLANEDD